MQDVMIRIDINEMKHAFRINGVTFSRKKLHELFPHWEATQETFYRFLIIAPFLAETKEVEDAGDEIGAYAIFKAKRIQEKLNLHGEMIPAFMLMAASMGNLEPEEMYQVADHSHDHICNCGVKKEFTPERRILH